MKFNVQLQNTCKTYFQETQAEIENRDSAWKEWLEDDEEEDQKKYSEIYT